MGGDSSYSSAYVVEFKIKLHITFVESGTYISEDKFSCGSMLMVKQIIINTLCVSTEVLL
jgi:hypothetical protein